jgi:phage nucleotide-binding protein
MNIYKASEIKAKKGTYLIYGPPGMGKTTALKYLPGNTLVLDVDRTSQVLHGCENIDIAEVDNIDTFKAWTDILSDLIANYKGKYDNIAVDNISELERCILSSLGKEGKNKGVPSQGDYQYTQFKLVNSIRYLKNVGSNIFLTAWEKTDQFQDASGTQYSRSFPQISDKIVNNICGLCDVVAKIAVNSDGERGFIMAATNSTYAKNQLDNRKGCLQNELIMEAKNAATPQVST